MTILHTFLSTWIHTRMKYVTSLLLASCSFYPLLSHAAPLTQPEAEVMTGKLCMLSQRMAKNYMAIGAGIRPDVALKDLDDNIATFEMNYQALAEYSENRPSGKLIQAIGEIWSHYRHDVISKPTRQDALNIIEESEKLLSVCEKAVNVIASQSGSPIAQMMEVSEHVITTSQKIAKYYFAMSWHIDDQKLHQNFDLSVKDLDDSLNTLIKYPANSTDVSAALAKVQSQWKLSNSGFKLNDNGQFVPTVISVTTDSISNKMENIVTMYATR
jgi:hypothetical protein